MNRSLLLIAVLLLGSTSVSRAVEILRWERLPLSVRLVVGQERVIFVERSMRVGVPATVAERLRVQSAGGAVYLKALAPIESTRVHLQDANSGALILLDLVAEDATDAAPLEPIRIIDDTATQARDGGSWPDDANARRTVDAPVVTTPVAVVLTRYAAQSFYAPLRTVEAVPGLVRVAAPRNLQLDTLLPTLPVRAKAVSAWRLGDHFVTAVRIANTERRSVLLDPRALQGNFFAATFQHPDLGPAGASTDMTMLYLVTRGHGLPDALLPSVAPIDEMLNVPTDSIDGDSHEK